MSECEPVPVNFFALDLSQPVEPHVLSQLSRACREWGFFYVTNCGISKDTYGKICSYSKEIFELPLCQKLKIGPSSALQTYTPPFIASPFFECIKVSGPDFLDSAKESADELFARDNSGFCKLLQEYGLKMEELAKKIMQILLLATLGHESLKKFDEREFSECHGYFRLVNYSPPGYVKEREAEGLGMHTDMSCITILFQDEIGGLQMRTRKGQWMDIMPCEESLVVNVGDLMQAWSNDQLRSCEHRVILRQAVNRLSLPFFWCFQDDKVVSAPDEVMGKGNPRLYEPFVCRDYLKFRESNEEGKFEKIGFGVKDFAGVKTHHHLDRNPEPDMAYVT
uniref:Fe2OG dioxygenase domain-containing protein n=1 Tax=Kalanchoe fedtschenkoi TaxID=63787 RepID=A0A7N0ZYV2_KALFE